MVDKIDNQTHCVLTTEHLTLLDRIYQMSERPANASVAFRQLENIRTLMETLFLKNAPLG